MDVESIFDSNEFNGNLFFPRPDYGTGTKGSEDIFIEIGKEVRIHMRRHNNPFAKFSMLFFHGNGEIVTDYDDLAHRFLDLGGEMIVVDYRGYGKSTGQPTLRNALSDASTIYEFLAENNILLKQVCVMGRSLGSASAIELCSKFPEIAACIIESGYADPIPLLERRGLKIRSISPNDDALFNNSTKIKQVQCPLLIMHGKMDVLISPQEALINHRSAGSKNKYLELFEGVGHNNILLAPGDGYFSCLNRFLKGLF